MTGNLVGSLESVATGEQAERGRASEEKRGESSMNSRLRKTPQYQRWALRRNRVATCEIEWKSVVCIL